MIFSGLRPTAETIHLGNFFGAIKPLMEASKNEEAFIFIADLHGIIGNKKSRLRDNILNQFAIYKAFGFKNIFLQSDILEITQIQHYFQNQLNLGRITRLHTVLDFKKEKPIGEIGVDLLMYPILMAADIIGSLADKVFVGHDQNGHINLAIDIRRRLKLKHKFEAIYPEEKQVVGLDGRKMSKSYNNYIDPFASEKVLKKQVMKIFTADTKLGDPRDYESCNVIKIFKLFKTEDELKDIKRRYADGTIGFAETKQALFETILEYFRPYREAKNKIMNEMSFEEMRKEMKITADKIRPNYAKFLDDIKSRING